jgi:hypothetical protein
MSAAQYCPICGAPWDIHLMAGDPCVLIGDDEEDVKMTDPMLQWFESDHLKPSLQAVSKPFGDLARKIVDEVPRNPERTVALRKLLEAKDCAVRAFLYVETL